MNEKTRIQIEEMKKQTIGVEIEMNHITREKASKLAADFFGTGRYEYTDGRNGYSTWSAWDESGREWKFQKDVSIAGPDSEKCELVTPILTYKDMETLQELIRRLRKAGAKSDATRGCGVHIHIGANGHTAQNLRNLANIMASHESLLASALNLDRNRMSRYCRTVSKATKSHSLPRIASWPIPVPKRKRRSCMTPTAHGAPGTGAMWKTTRTSLRNCGSSMWARSYANARNPVERKPQSLWAMRSVRPWSS